MRWTESVDTVLCIVDVCWPSVDDNNYGQGHSPGLSFCGDICKRVKEAE